jgi:hypothetical protein
MEIHIGYVIERYILVGQSSLFVILMLVQFSLWTQPIYWGKIKKIQQFFNITTFLHNIIALALGYDSQCVFGIMNPASLVIIFSVLVQIQIGTALFWWRLIGNATKKFKDQHWSVDWLLTKKGLASLFCSFLCFVILGCSLAILKNSVRFLAISIFAASLMMSLIVFLTWKFLRSTQEVHKKVRSAKASKKTNEKDSLLTHQTDLEQETINDTRAEAQRRAERWIWISLRVVIFVFLVEIAVAVDTAFSSLTLEEGLGVPDASVLTFRWWIAAFASTDLAFSTIMTVMAWLPVRDLCKPVQTADEAIPTNYKRTTQDNQISVN